MTITRRSFAVGKLPTALLAGRRRVRRGTVFGYVLSEPALVRIAIKRQRAGRRKGRRCVARTKALRKHRRCDRLEAVGALQRAGRQTGPASVPFSGRLGTKAVKPGRYRAVITATDAARNRSKRVSVRFRVLRPR